MCPLLFLVIQNLHEKKLAEKLSLFMDSCMIKFMIKFLKAPFSQSPFSSSFYREPQASNSGLQAHAWSQGSINSILKAKQIICLFRPFVHMQQLKLTILFIR